MERAFAFMHELDSPVHTPGLGKAETKPGTGEIRIDKRWGIQIEDAAPIEVQTAGKDFADFLAVSFGIKLKEPLPGNPLIHIRAGQNISRPPSARDEGFTVNAEATGIRIQGCGPRGALYGVFFLEDLMISRGGPCLRTGVFRRSPRFAPRILRSYCSPYYTETTDGRNHYSDNYLARLAHLGFDAIWLRGELRDLSRTAVFPELGQKSERNVYALNELVRRAAAWGIGVYLYLCEPHGLPINDPFWKNHPDVRGPEGPEMGLKGITLNALCVSTAKVRRFLYQATRNLLIKASGLEGLLLITASEHTGHCKQRNSMAPCPRCAERPSSDIAAEIITLICRGGRDAGSPARVVAWNWAWDKHLGEQAENDIIRRIPKDVIWMGNVENGGIIRRFGQKAVIWEYSLCYPGPSPVFCKKAIAAQGLGHALWGKVQINVTHELASMPYIPVPHLLHKKFAGLARTGVEGILSCWIFGSYPGVGARMAGAMMWTPLGNPQQTLLDLAAGLYGRRAAPAVVQAWRHFSRGYAMYPFDGVYSHVFNDAPAHPFYFLPVRRHERTNWLSARGAFGDILNWCRQFSPEITVQCLEALLAEWDQGLALINKALTTGPARLRREAERDRDVCEAIGVHFRSGLHFIRFIRLRDRLPGLGGVVAWPHPDYQKIYGQPLAKTSADIRKIIKEIRAIVGAEYKMVSDYLPMCRRDSRLGFHSEGGYRFHPRDLTMKLRQLRHMLMVTIPRYENRRKVLPEAYSEFYSADY